MWRQALRLSVRECGIFLEAWVLLVAADIALRLLPSSRLLALCCRRPRNEMDDALSALRLAVRIGRLVDVAGPYALVPATDLKKALVVSWLLARRGVATTVCFGAARGDRGLVGHAWLERDGAVVFGETAGRTYAFMIRA